MEVRDGGGQTGKGDNGINITITFDTSVQFENEILKDPDHEEYV